MSDSYASDYGNPWGNTMGDDYDPSTWDLGIDWGGLGVTDPNVYDGGTLDPVYSDTGYGNGDPWDWNSSTDNYGSGFGDGNAVGDWTGFDDIMNWVDDLVNASNQTPPTTTTPTTVPPRSNTTPTNPATNPRPSTSSPSSGASSGSSMQDLSKLVNAILQAIKGPTTPTTPTQQQNTPPGSISSGLNIGSLALVGGGALVTWLILRKR